MKTKNNLIFGILLFGISFIVLQSSIALAATTPAVSTYCAQHTTYGAWCQDVPLSQVDTNYAYSQTSCQATTYCQTGTCVNVQTGTCLPSSQATCNSAQGGTWYSTAPSSTPVCQIGCCLIGDQASFTTKAACNSYPTLYGVNTTFNANVNNEADCISSAQPQAKGACVYDTGNGRTCTFTTRQSCKSISSSTFHQDFLCTNPTLGTNCAMTKQTTCLKTADQVYFIDSCGNQANVYDANRVSDTNYWSYVAGTNGVTLDIGDSANIESTTNGYCNYLSGSTCMQYNSAIDGGNIPAYGNNICRNVNCVSTSDQFVSLFNTQYGRTPKNGESWCGLETADSSGNPLIQLEPNGHIPITFNNGNTSVSVASGITLSTMGSNGISTYDKTGNNPGDTEVLFICANGRVTTEVQAQYRNYICIQNQTTLSSGIQFNNAQFVYNRWTFCFAQNSSKDCLNTDQRDCQWVTGASVLKDSAGQPMVWDQSQDLLVPTSGPGDTRMEASCVPKYPYGFDTTPSNTCGAASRVCYVNYTQSPTDAATRFWRVEGGTIFGESSTITCLGDYNDPNKPEIVTNWQTSLSNLCKAQGDCGISVNYIGTNGANRVSDVFQVIVANQTGEEIHG